MVGINQLIFAFGIFRVAHPTVVFVSAKAIALRRFIPGIIIKKHTRKNKYISDLPSSQY